MATAGVDDRKRLEQQLAAAKRLEAYREARGSLLRYIQVLMPDPDNPDINASRYEVTPQARLLCEVMEKVERGALSRVAVSIGPQLGKSEVLSRCFMAWAAGRRPSRNLMLGAYNQTFAEEFGEEVRARVESPLHQAIFPNHKLTKGAVDLLITEERGKTAFVGVGGSGTGKPADFFVVDDPIRSDDDAQSQTYRDKIWKWFNAVAMTRCHGKSGIVVVHTRWHQDDLIGRLCDPDHPERHRGYKGVADPWTYINIPAVVTDPKLARALGLTLDMPTDRVVVSMFGAKPMSALWPERKPLALLAEAKVNDARTFNALYMGRPTPDDGAYFKSEWLVEYEAKDLPKNLRVYGASDHAVSEKEGRDPTVLGCVGIDEKDDIWVLPDVVWDRMETDRTVEELLTQFKVHRPDLWWMEDELISKSFGPFLHKRMHEEKVYVTIETVRPAKDKQTRARAIQGRMSMRKVHFPAFASWWRDARGEILRFPFGAHDDFVDWLAHIGMGLTREMRATRPGNDNVIDMRGYTVRRMLQDSKARAERDDRLKANEGW